MHMLLQQQNSVSNGKEPGLHGNRGDIHSIDASLDGDSRVVHVAANVAQDLGLETELADSLAVAAGLLRGGRRGKFELELQGQHTDHLG